MNVPKGAFCEHRRMKYKKREYCKQACRVECPDCVFYWLLFEDPFVKFAPKRK